MNNVDELLQNVVDTVDNANSQKVHLTELLGTLQEAKTQVKESAIASRQNVKCHFERLQSSIEDALNSRMAKLLEEIAEIEQNSLGPLTECEDIIKQGVKNASSVMEDGKSVLVNNPKDNIDNLIRFKDDPATKSLHSIPEVPNLCDVPSISVELPDGFLKRVKAMVDFEGRVIERAPVQITDIVERPGSLFIKWTEVEEELEVGQFCLQFCKGQVKTNDNRNVTFHTAYVGPGMSCTVKHIQPNTSYSFRVSCRADDTNDWCVWSVPQAALTTIPPYQWSSSTEGYCTSNENKTSTRISEGITRVLYSESPSYVTGSPISFRILDIGEKSFVDGIGISVSSDDIETLKRPNAVFVGTDGLVYVDGQEMKNKLPDLTRNSQLTIETEMLPNGKVRVSVQVEEKEVTFDWKIDKPNGILGMMSSMVVKDKQTEAVNMYFAMVFSHEDWKIAVE